MILLIIFFVLVFIGQSPEIVTALISYFPFIENILDVEWLFSGHYLISTPSISGIITIISIILAGGILALSIFRGIRIIFPAKKDRNLIKNTLVVLSIEISVIVFMMMAIVSSRAAKSIFSLIDGFFPLISLSSIPLIQFLTSTGAQFSTIGLIGIVVYFAYLLVPVNSPKKFSAFMGAALCTFAYSCTFIIFGLIMDRARFNLIYGTLGNLVIVMVNVFLFFIIFFFAAQFVYVVDSFKQLPSSLMDVIKKKDIDFDKAYYEYKSRESTNCANTAPVAPRE
jgi:membrane protein